MSEKKDQLEEILKDQFYKEAKQIEEEVGLNDDSEEISEELKVRMKQALDQKIREREMRAKSRTGSETIAGAGKFASSTNSENVVVSRMKPESSSEHAKNIKCVETATDDVKEDAYIGLSAEDREALRIGRELLKNQGEEKKVYMVRRKKRTIRRLVALAAVLILVMALGMTSFGGPERVLQFVKSTVGNRQVSKVNSSDKNKIIEEEDEEKAYELIGEKFGIEPVRILWKPETMEFKKLVLDSVLQVAEMEYEYDGEKTEYLISASYGEVSWGHDKEDKVIDHYNSMIMGTKIEITGYETPETERNRYEAEFKYKNLYYSLSGEMKKEEMDNIIKNLYFM